MNRLKYLFASTAVVAMAHAWAMVPVQVPVSGTTGSAVDVPAYTIVGRDSTCEVFVYSPAPMSGLHLAYLTDEDKWVDVGQLCVSQYDTHGGKSQMLNPFVTKANDGTWRALWSVGSQTPHFAAAWSEDLVTWRPQDFPVVKERGVSDAVAYQMEDGNFDIYLKTAQGKRYVQASADFRTFVEDSLEASADDILWQRDTATINGKLYQGCDFDIPAIHLQYIRSWFAALAEERRMDSRPLPKSEADLKTLADVPSGDISVTVQLDEKGAKRISSRLIGLDGDAFLADTEHRFSAELIKNGDFECAGKEKTGAVAAWQGVESTSAEQGVSKNNPHYVTLDVTPIYNIGWNGFPHLSEDSQAALEKSKTGVPYEVSFYARNMEGDKKQVNVAFVDEDGKVLSEEKFKVQGGEWQKYKSLLFAKSKDWDAAKGKIRFAMIPKGSGKVAVDMVSVLPYSVADNRSVLFSSPVLPSGMSPRFISFTDKGLAGTQDEEQNCHWKESVGPMKDRKPTYTQWGNGQSTGLGFYEYFLWCEQVKAEPFPILPVGQGKTAVQDVLDLIEWANGDASVSPWAKMRAEAGHPAPFHLKVIGIGHGGRLSSPFEKRYVEIAEAVKKKCPEMEVIGTAGTDVFPSSDYVEGWKVAKEHRPVFDAIDERMKKLPGWFVNHQDYYDGYDRQQAKVSVGQWKVDSPDATDSLLTKCLYLCQLERNGDVVEQVSFGKHDMELCKYANMQGDTYVPVSLDLPDSLKKYVGVSVVKDSQSEKMTLRIVNALPRNLRIQVAWGTHQEVLVPARQVKCVSLCNNHD